MQQQEGDKHGNKPDSFYNREYNELDTKIVTLLKFKGFTHHILDLNWMATIKKPMSKNPPRALTLDYRYNVVYQLYLAITSKKINSHYTVNTNTSGYVQTYYMKFGAIFRS